MFRLRAEQKGLSLVFERAPDLPQFIRADQGKLSQVLINLLGNAIKFTERGSVRLRVAAQGSQLYFQIQDTGIGIPPDKQGNIFDAFTRAHDDLVSSGTGLGLAISRQYVEAMGGKIAVESTVGQGSIFSVRLPVEPVAIMEIQPPPPTRRVIGLEPGQGVYRILVVEDEQMNRELLSAVLQSAGAGFEIREAVDGQQAIKLWEEWQPHLVWMDMQMPVMDGRQATRAIRQCDPSVKIVALTAYALEEQKSQFLTAGCDDFVRKPFREADIFNAMAKHLGARFVYEDNVKPSQQIVTPTQALASMNPSVLPRDLITALHLAASSANVAQVELAIGRIREYDSRLAEALDTLAENFEYQAISNWLEAKCEIAA